MVALWREGLLAQKVLKGETRGYRHHPQLIRFRVAGDPGGVVASYLRLVAEEAANRGYRFDESRIGRPSDERITCTTGQLAFEWEHLREKLRLRDTGWLGRIEQESVCAHPLFDLVEGGVEPWERGHRIVPT